MLHYPYLRPRYVLYRINKLIKETLELRHWEKQGKPLPPPHLVKQRTVKSYGKTFHLHTLIETGTYTGAMVFAMQDEFAKIYTIELDENLSRAAQSGFAKFDHIEAIQGDSGEVLPQIMAHITEPCLFWLDGHYSGEGTAKGGSDTPILRELGCIFSHSVNGHVILIDDAHCFIGENDYPTIEELRRIALSNKPDWHFEVSDNIVRIHPSEYGRASV